MWTYRYHHNIIKNMMLLVLLIIAKLVEGTIKISVIVDEDKETVQCDSNNSETYHVTQKCRDSFGLDDETVKKAFEKIFYMRPVEVYFSNPQSSGAENINFTFFEVTSETTLKSAKITSNQIESNSVFSQDFENSSSNKVKVNAAFTQNVENSVTTVWSVDLSQVIDYELSLIFSRATGNFTITVGSTIGLSSGKSEKNIGTSSGVEIELHPNQAVTAELTMIKRIIQMDIEYQVALHGKVTANFGLDNFVMYDHVDVNKILTAAGLKNNLIVTEAVKIETYEKASFKVFDKKYWTNAIIFED